MNPTQINDALHRIAEHLDITTPEQAVLLADLIAGMTPADASAVAMVLIDYASDAEDEAEASRDAADEAAQTARIWADTFSAH